MTRHPAEWEKAARWAAFSLTADAMIVATLRVGGSEACPTRARLVVQKRTLSDSQRLRALSLLLKSSSADMV